MFRNMLFMTEYSKGCVQKTPYFYHGTKCSIVQGGVIMDPTILSLVNNLPADAEFIFRSHK